MVVLKMSYLKNSVMTICLCSVAASDETLLIRSSSRSFIIKIKAITIFLSLAVIVVLAVILSPINFISQSHSFWL